MSVYAFGAQEIYEVQNEAHGSKLLKFGAFVFVALVFSLASNLSARIYDMPEDLFIKFFRHTWLATGFFVAVDLLALTALSIAHESLIGSRIVLTSSALLILLVLFLLYRGYAELFNATAAFREEPKKQRCPGSEPLCE